MLNPLAADRPQLTSTLLLGLLEALGRNVSRGIIDVALFAIAQVVQPTSAGRVLELPRWIAGPPTPRSPPSTPRCRISPTHRGGADRPA